MTAGTAQKLQDAEVAFRTGDLNAVIALCRNVLQQAAGANANGAMTASHAYRLLTEAMIVMGDMAGARREFFAFWSSTEPAELHMGIREQMMHNAGRALALQWLMSEEPSLAMTELLTSMTAPELAVPIESTFPGLTAARIRLLRAVGALAGHDEAAASTHLNIALPALESVDSRSERDAVWMHVARLAQETLNERLDAARPRAERPPQATPTAPSANVSQPGGHTAFHGKRSRREGLRRHMAPELLDQGLPGPLGLWIRRPRAGEQSAINGLLRLADDELAPWVVDAIDEFKLSSARIGMLTGQSLSELATELHEGGRERFMSGFTFVLVAVTPDNKLVGAVQASPPFQLLDQFGELGVPAANLRAAVVAMTQISGIAVASSHRRRGIGKALARWASDLSWRIGTQLLYGQFPTGQGLEQFFTSCGFETCDHLSSLDLTPYGIPITMSPQPGSRFFKSHFELVGDLKPGPV